MLINNKYAIPLTLPTIAISKSCEVLDVHTRQVIKNKQSKYNTSKTKNEYHKYYIHGKHVLVHRLMLDAWVYNDTPITHIIGNHIDGDKLNNILTNLEWSTFKDNIRHAFKIGLRTDNYKVRIRNIHTKKIKEFYSISEMCRYIGVSSIAKFRIDESHLGRETRGWEIRGENDTRDWYFQTGSEPIVPPYAMYMFKIYQNGILIKTYFNIIMVNLFLNLPRRQLIPLTVEYVKNHKTLKLEITCLKKIK